MIRVEKKLLSKLLLNLHEFRQFSIHSESSFEISQNVSQPFVKNQPLKPRLENHFKENLFPEMSILLLENQIKKLLKENSETLTASSYLNSVKNDVLNFEKYLNGHNGDCGSSNLLKNSFDCFVNDLPTNPNKNLAPATGWIAPTSTHQFSINSFNQNSKNNTRPLPNPIDYTSVVHDVLYAKPDPPPPPPFSPLPHRMPTLKGIDLEIITDDAIGNKYRFLHSLLRFLDHFYYLLYCLYNVYLDKELIQFSPVKVMLQRRYELVCP